jgi:hypothetical protein
VTYWFPYDISDDPCENVDLRKVRKNDKLFIPIDSIDENQCVNLKYKDKYNNEYLQYTTVDRAKRLFAKGYKFEILTLDFVNNIRIKAIERYSGKWRI